MRCHVKGLHHHDSKERGRSICVKLLNKGVDVLNRNFLSCINFKPEKHKSMSDCPAGCCVNRYQARSISNLTSFCKSLTSFPRASIVPAWALVISLSSEISFAGKRGCPLNRYFLSEAFRSSISWNLDRAIKYPASCLSIPRWRPYCENCN